MKLCFISVQQWSVDVLRGDTSAAGGAEAQTAYLARAFAELGHSVDLIYGSGASTITVHNVAGVRCIKAFPAWNHPGSLLTFWRALRESAADLIYMRLPLDFMWLVSLFVKMHPQSKFVYAIGNDPHCNPWHTYPKDGWFHNPIYALGLRTVDIVAIQHQAQAKMLRPYTKAKVVLIPNLMRSIQSEPRQYNDTTIDAIWISHIRPQKQLSILLDIAEQLPLLQFVVIGGFGLDPSRGALEARMQGIRNLRFEGPRPFEDVIKLLRASKVLVNTSSWEGFPNSMLDAWSVGVPVVSLQIDPGGVITREGLGLVSGTKSQLACDILKLVEERSPNCEMGKKGHDYVRRAHSIDSVCQGFGQILPGFQKTNVVAPEEVA